MKNITRHPLLIILAILAIVIVIAVKCEKETITEVEYIYDTTLVQIETEVPVPYKITINDTILVPRYIHTSDTVKIPLEIDTMAILSDYYSKVEYRDTISDESIKIFLNETVTQNRIIDRDLSYKWMEPTEVITYIKNKNTIYTGLIFYQHFLTNKSSIGFSINYSNEKLSGTFAVDPFNKGVYVGGAVRLKSW